MTALLWVIIIMGLLGYFGAKQTTVYIEAPKPKPVNYDKLDHYIDEFEAQVAIAEKEVEGCRAAMDALKAMDEPCPHSNAKERL